MYLVGNNSIMQPTQLGYSLWINLLFFMMYIYKLCFPPMILVLAMKCCTKMPCSLPHNHYCCLLSSPICLPCLLICTCLISPPIACPPSSVLCWCFFWNFCCASLFWVVFYLCLLHADFVKSLQIRKKNHDFIIMIFYCGLMVHIRHKSTKSG